MPLCKAVVDAAHFRETFESPSSALRRLRQKRLLPTTTINRLIALATKECASHCVLSGHAARIRSLVSWIGPRFRSRAQYAFSGVSLFRDRKTRFLIQCDVRAASTLNSRCLPRGTSARCVRLQMAEINTRARPNSIAMQPISSFLLRDICIRCAVSGIDQAQLLSTKEGGVCGPALFR